jgi:hypothetical protein
MMPGATLAARAADPPILSKRRRDKARSFVRIVPTLAMWFLDILLLLPNKTARSCRVLLLRGAERQSESEGRALAGGRFDPDAAAVELDDALRDGKP